ncbi:hypothetical protein [Wenjunlia tyrosinilytica]|nr:hypothetical protein [Wenjunlia tyrosinilytica]
MVLTRRAAGIAGVMALMAVVVVQADAGAREPVPPQRRASHPTWFSGFDAGPEPVRKGRTITIGGTLMAREAHTVVLKGKKVKLYFQPKGSSSWYYLGNDVTHSDGRFSVGVRATRDGSFRAVYGGSSAYRKTTSRGDYVDVR